MFLWLIILLSALLFNAAFFAPEFFGWGALGGIVLVLWFLYHQKDQQKKRQAFCRFNHVRYNFYAGLCWGSLVFFTQLYWLLCVITEFSLRSWLFKVLAYTVLCTYFASTCAFWFASMALLGWYIQSYKGKIVAYVLITIGYFVWLARWGALILANGDGYPLLNPLIPLCSYRLFVRFVCLISSCVIGPNYFDSLSSVDKSFAYLKPLNNRGNSWMKHPSILGQQVYHHLCDAKNNRLSDNVRIYCAPESFFPYSVNKFDALIDFWATVLSEQEILILGGQSEFNGKVHQSAFFIHKRRIKKIYVKKHLVPFFEKTPLFWRFLGCKGSILCADVDNFSYHKNRSFDKVFLVDSHLMLLPQLCSEFIWVHKVKCFRRWLTKSNVPVIVWLVNDSWFIPSFRKILQLAGILRAAWIGLPVIYVGHQKDENGTTGKRLGF